MKSPSGFALILFFIILISCDAKRVFEQNVAFKNESWNYKDTVHFNVNIADTIHAYNIFINIRNTGSYEYSNIFLFITTYAPNGNFVKDTFEITLADKQGKWIGKGTGNILSIQFPYKMNIKFPYRGIYMFNIQHAMWNEDLHGITDVGLRVEKFR